MEKENRSDNSLLNILISEVIDMTVPINTNDPSSTPLTYKDYMKLRREKVRDRWLKKGSLISGQILSTASIDNIVELFPTEPNMAI